MWQAFLFHDSFMDSPETTSRTTMADLARLAGVNVSTVSRALNDSPLVKPDTKAEILRIAEDLGYSVNVAARNLRRRTSDTLALVIPIRPDSGQSLSDPFFLEMIGAVSVAVSERGYDLLLSTPPEDNTLAERRLLQTGRADGLIIIGQAGREERLERLGKVADRVVVWGGGREDTPYTLVGSDNVSGGQLATTHLIERGKGPVIFLGNTDLPEVELRYKGYLLAHAHNNIDPDPAHVIRVGFGREIADVPPAIRKAVSDGPAFSGVFAASDALAIATMQALRDEGLDVPSDVGVVGYDNVAQAAHTRPPLTTISQSIADGGAALVDALISKLEGREVNSRLMPTELVQREST